MPPSIVVTGATGFAGSHLLDRLPADAAITALAHRGGRAPARSGVTWADFDLLDRSSIEAAIRAARPDVVFHLAGPPHMVSAFDNPSLTLRIHAVGTMHLLDAVRAHAPRARVVVVTSAMVYAATTDPRTETTPTIPESPYGLSKLAQDRLAMLAAADGLDVVVARPFNHTGPRQDPSFAIPGFAKQIASIERGESPAVIHVGNLDAERDLTDVRDVVDGYIALGSRGERGTAYNICSGTAWRMGDLLDRLVRLARVKVDVQVDEALLRPVELSRLVGDNARIRALGWQPRIDTETMLHDVLAYWRSRTSE